MLVLAKNRFVEMLQGGNIFEKGGRYYTLTGVEVKPDEPISQLKPKKTTAKKSTKKEDK